MAAPAFTLSQLCHPELLSIEQLKTLIKDRCIELKKIDTLSKEELLAVVHRVAVPLPQRLRPGICTDEVPNAGSFAVEKKQQSTCINFERKTIKLKKSNPDTTGNSNGIRSKKAKVQIPLNRTIEQTTMSNIEKPCSDEQKEAPVKKRTKITWP